MNVGHSIDAGDPRPYYYTFVLKVPYNGDPDWLRVEKFVEVKLGSNPLYYGKHYNADRVARKLGRFIYEGHNVMKGVREICDIWRGDIPFADVKVYRSGQAKFSEMQQFWQRVSIVAKPMGGDMFEWRVRGDDVDFVVEVCSLLMKD